MNKERSPIDKTNPNNEEIYGIQGPDPIEPEILTTNNIDHSHDPNNEIHGLQGPDAVKPEVLSTDKIDPNHDQISGEPGSHPVGTGIGAAGVGTAATVIGAVVGGPVGGVIGAVVGSVVGGLAGKETAEKVNPTAEDAHWRKNYTSRPYVEEGRQYEDYQDAYKIGYEGYGRYAGTNRNYDEVEPDLQREYEAQHPTGLEWGKAKYAIRDAWDRTAGIHDKP